MKTIDYVTIIDPVFEVTLLGRANHNVWQTYLREENLEIQNVQGATDLIISVVDSKFMGVRFQEFSISVKLSENHYFLAHAYNSIALFARAERAFFQTPYYKGDIVVKTNHITLSHGRSTIFEACLPEQVQVTNSHDECQELLVHLPKGLRKKPSQPHFFYARLEGFTESYAADATRISVTPGVGDTILRILNESQFQV